MYITVTEHDFIDAFRAARPDNFTYEGLGVLFEHLEACEEYNNSIELDVIAICCDFTEYVNFEELQSNYNVETKEELMENTTVIPIGEDSFIIQDY